MRYLSKGLGPCSENFEYIKSKAIKVTIIGTILHFVIPFLKWVKIFESQYSFKFGFISALFYLIKGKRKKLLTSFLCDNI